MHSSPRHGHLGRLSFYVALALVSTHCRCQYESLTSSGVDGSVNDGSVTDGSDAAQSDANVSVPTIVLGNDQNTNRKGSAIGTPYNESCPGDQVLIGLDGEQQDSGFELFTAIVGNCGSLHVQPDGTTITVTPEGTLPLRGDTSFSIPFTLQCPANQVVVGFEGNAGTAVDAATLKCAPLSIQGGTIVIGAVTVLSPTPGGTMGAPYDEPCQAGLVVRGRFGYSDTILQALGMICTRPTLVP